jgi:amino acid transporter
VGTEGYSRSGESEAERLDRNYSELLQELRVAQTGVQILFAFLLGIAFQNRFTRLESYQRGIYLVTLVAAACAAILLIAPVAVHRMLFRRHQKDDLVRLTAVLASLGLIALGVAILCAVLFVLAVVVNLTLGITVTGILAVLVVGLWYVLPYDLRRRHPSPDLRPHGADSGDPGR